MKDLSVLPSPYLSGVFDPLMGKNPASEWLILWETNRGCPFQCTFCVDGVGSRDRIFKSSLERNEAELVYIAKRCKSKYLQLDVYVSILYKSLSK